MSIAPATAEASPRAIAGGASDCPDGDTHAERRPVRVMHVVYTLRPGGMEFGVLKLVQGLDRRRVQSAICSTTPAATEMLGRVPPDVAVFELRRRQGNDPRLVRDLYRLFRRERPDVVHTHAWGTLVEGIIAARLARVPCIVHGEHGTLQVRSYQARIQRRVWSMATQVLSVSRKLSERMASVTGFPVEQIRTIQNGVDCSRFSPALREDGRRALDVPPDMLAIGTAGRLVPVKDHACLISALASLRDRGLKFRAFIAGEGPLRDCLGAQIASARLNHEINLLGHTEDIARMMAGLDLFVLSSRSEGMSNTILEAMASGTAIVATDVGGARELVDDGLTGLLAPPENPAALAAAVEELARDPTRRRQMGSAARIKATHEFDLRRMLRDYEALYLGFPTQPRTAARTELTDSTRGSL
jgi:sugar transferase (PEP-CTERM/EpsH1 system associated)